MAKRNRGSHRPGQRRSDRHAPSRPQTRPAGGPLQGLTADEEARAAELESQIVAQERSSAVARSRDQARSEVEPAEKPRVGAPLAVRAAAEYAYVSRDVRRIVRIGGSMLGILALVFVLVRFLHVISI